MNLWRDRSYPLGLVGVITLVGWAMGLSVVAQPVPDRTLGAEQSQVVPLGGANFDIGGGAPRGANLFHSFQEFGVENGGSVYFLNPAGIENILSRVTGNNPSVILGTLGVFGGDANLFLMNPNGIVFGPNAQLDVQGSFVATTADAIGFGEHGVFSAIDPQVPSQLLTVNPSAFFFNQINPAPIENQSRADAGLDPSNSFSTFGLRVPDGQSLLLLGGDIDLNGGGIVAFGGRVELGGVAETGSIGLTVDGNNLQLDFLEETARADVSLGDRAGIITAGTDGGSVTINARNINILEGSTIWSGIGGNLGTVDSQAGDIILSATESFTISGAGSYVFNYIASNATGDSGDVVIETGKFSLGEGSQVGTLILGNGNLGDLRIIASDSVELNGDSSGNLITGLYAQVQGTGNSGDITIEAGSLRTANRAQIGATTLGIGNSGNIRVTVRDNVSLSNSIIISEVSEGTGQGQAGDITIEAGSLELRNGAALLADTENLGDAGNIIINVRDAVILAGQGPSALDLADTVPSQISSTVDFSGTAVGEGGEIRITANQLSMSDRAFITTETFGQGNAGNLFFDIDEIRLSGSSVITSAVRSGGQGDGGNIEIASRSINLSDGSRINAFVERQQQDAQDNVLPGGQGRGGTLRITATDSITLSGTDDNGFSSGFFTLTERGASGRAGDIFITTGNLQIADGAIVTAGTFNPGESGDINIRAANLELLNGGQIVTSTRNRSNAGQINLNITENTLISGVDPNFRDRRNRTQQFTQTPSGRSQQVDDIIISQGRQSGIFANTEANSTGDGGSIRLTTPNLQMTDRATISTQSLGTGEAGDIFVNVRELMQLTDSDIATAAPRSTGGDIQINTAEGYGSGLILLRGDSDITTVSQRDGGNIEMRARAIIAFDDSDILTTSEDGAGGDITLSSFFSQNSPFNRDSPLDGNDRVDINASGQISSGNISIPDTGFVQDSLADLPESAIDTESIIAASCVVRSQEVGGTFIITGRGGLPERPGADRTSSYTTGEVRSIPQTSEQSWQLGDPIVEPQGLYQLEDGRMILSQECD